MSDYEKSAEKGSAPQASTDEYTQLIEFIRAQKNASSDDEGADETHIERRRNWLMPWKVTETRVNKNGEEEQVAAKVPSSW